VAGVKIAKAGVRALQAILAVLGVVEMAVFAELSIVLIIKNEIWAFGWTIGVII
jgi:hypothetical protein